MHHSLSNASRIQPVFEFFRSGASRWGRWVGVCAALAFGFYLSPSVPALFVAFAFALSLVPPERREIRLIGIAGLSVGALAFSTTNNSKALLAFLAREGTHLVYLGAYPRLWLLLLICFSGLMLLFAVEFVRFRWVARFPLLAATFWMGALFLLSEALAPIPQLGPFVRFVFFLNFMWILFLPGFFADQGEGPPSWRRALLRGIGLLPFWNHHIPNPIPVQPSDLLGSIVKDKESYFRLLLRSLRLLGTCLLVGFIWGRLSFYLRTVPEFRAALGAVNLFEPELIARAAVSGAGQVLMAWAATVYACFDVLVSHFFLTYGYAVVLAGVAGFHLPENVRKPWASRSFAQFVASLMRYYNDLLSRFGVEPLFRLLGPVRNIQVRMFLSVFLGVSAVGVLFHVFHIHRRFFVDGPEESLFWYSQRLPYFLILGILMASSVVLRREVLRKFGKAKDSPLGRSLGALKPLFYLLVFAALWRLAFLREKPLIDAASATLKLLFGI